MGGSADISDGRTESGEIYLCGAGPKVSSKISLLLPDISPMWTRGPLVAEISDIFIGYCARARAAQAVDQKLYFASTSSLNAISVSRNDDEWLETNASMFPSPGNIIGSGCAILIPRDAGIGRYALQVFVFTTSGTSVGKAAIHGLYGSPGRNTEKRRRQGVDFYEKLISLSGASGDTTTRSAFACITPLSRKDGQGLANAPLAIREIIESPPSTTTQKICIRRSGACAGSEVVGYLRDIAGRQMNFPSAVVDKGVPNPDGCYMRR